MTRIIRQVVILISLIAAALSGSVASWSNAPTVANAVVASTQSFATEGFLAGYIGSSPDPEYL